ncbi:MAG: hypothetical protein ACTSQ7_15605, partial [Alphaproteobacteria bacterium]
MRQPAYRSIQTSMIWAGVCAGLGAASLLPHMLTGQRPALSLQIVIALSWMAAVVLLVRVWLKARVLGRGIESARTSVLNLVADRNAMLPEKAPDGTPSGVVVFTEQGQVSLLNAPARQLLGSERARVG